MNKKGKQREGWEKAPPSNLSVSSLVCNTDEDKSFEMMPCIFKLKIIYLQNSVYILTYLHIIL